MSVEKYPREECPHCNGTKRTDCEKCGGWGWVEDRVDGGTMNCPKCDGAECEECD